MELSFIKLSPNGNMTLLVETPVPRNRQLAIGKRLIATDHVGAEQAGFIEPACHPQAAARLQMMAGEFCGNATLSLACWLFSKEHPNPGEQAEIHLEVSGADAPVSCRITKQAQGYLGTLSMPLPQRVTTKTYWLNGRSYALQTVELPGIHHIIVPKALWGDQAKQMAELAAAQWDIPSEAFGILLFDADTMTLEPLVCVKGVSLIWEHGCGSGTTAVGAALALQQQSSLTLQLKQTGGVMEITAQYHEHQLTALYLTVQIQIVATGIAYLESCGK